MKNNIKIFLIACLMVLLSGFTAFKEKVPPPKDMPKRTQDKNAGIVIPSFDASPYDIIEKSYDPLDAFMRDPEAGIFMSLSTSNFDFTPHKLTFHHKKLGFVTHTAYHLDIRLVWCNALLGHLMIRLGARPEPSPPHVTILPRRALQPHDHERSDFDAAPTA